MMKIALVTTTTLAAATMTTPPQPQPPPKSPTRGRARTLGETPTNSTPEFGSSSTSTTTITTPSLPHLTSSSSTSTSLPNNTQHQPQQQQESHRIYWQQWLRSNETSTGSRREWVTSSAAVRISPGARAADVTKLLRTSLGLPPPPPPPPGGNNNNRTCDQQQNNDDALVLVGTLYSLSRDYVQFGHEQQPPKQTYGRPSLKFAARVQQQQQQQQRNGPLPPHLQQSSSFSSSMTTTTTSTSKTNGNTATIPTPSQVSSAMGKTTTTVVPPKSGPLKLPTPLLASTTTNATLPSTSNVAANTTTITATSGSSSADPFHVVHTLHADDHPLTVRNLMTARVQQLQNEAGASRTIMAPKLQWFFVPSLHHCHHHHRPSSKGQSNVTTTMAEDSTANTRGNRNQRNAAQLAETIPNCIDLEGYCTAMEESDDEEDDSEDLIGDNDNKSSYVHQQHRNSKPDPMYDEDEYSDNDESDHDDVAGLATAKTTDIQDWLGTRFAWLSTNSHDDNSPAPHTSRREARQRRRRRTLLRQQRETVSHSVALPPMSTTTSSSAAAAVAAAPSSALLAGFLLKQSPRDRHVWRRVYCVLTEDYLWFVSRIYRHKTAPKNNGRRKLQPPTSPTPSHRNGVSSSPSTNGTTACPTAGPAYAKHGRIRLTRALLLEPTRDYAPLYRTPYAFEVVTATGTTHVFRATRKGPHAQWMRALSDRMVQSFENSLVAHADMMLDDQSLARHERMQSVVQLPVAPAHHWRGPHVASVLRWGIQVADYREYIRYVQSILPAKNPVVVVSSNGHGGKRAAMSSSRLPTADSAANVPTDPVVRERIRGAWQQAANLLARAAVLGNDLQEERRQRHERTKQWQENQEGPPQIPPANALARSTSGGGSSVEILFRHIDYVITGRRRHHQHSFGLAARTRSDNSLGHRDDNHDSSSHDETSVSSRASDGTHGKTVGNSRPPAAKRPESLPNHQQLNLPPLDLFDPLLAELQSQAASLD